jgi:hypothetical protein
MSERQSQRSVALSAQHRQEAEVTAAEELERAAAETAAMAARAARLAMAELAAVRAEVVAAAAADVAHAAAVELKALRASSTDSSVSTDDDRDNELKLVREAALMGADASMVLRAAEIAAFTGGAALHPRTGTMVTMGSRPLSGTSVPATGGLPSPRPTTSSGSR